MTRGKYCKTCGLYDGSEETTDKRCATCAMPISKKAPPIILIANSKSKFFCCKKCIRLFLTR